MQVKDVTVTISSQYVFGLNHLCNMYMRYIYIWHALIITNTSATAKLEMFRASFK